MNGMLKFLKYSLITRNSIRFYVTISSNMIQKQINSLQLLQNNKFKKNERNSNQIENVINIMRYFYGLDDSNQIVKVISKDLVDSITKNGISFNSSNEISILFKSLSTMTGNSLEIQKLHSLLLNNLPTSTSLPTIPFPLPINTMVDVYSSVKNMSSQSPNSQQLFQIMFPHLQFQYQYLTYDQCSNILYCFQSTLIYSEIVAETIKLILNRLNELNLQLVNSSSVSLNGKYLTTNQIAKCMYGLRNFSNDILETKLIYQILSSHFIQNKSKPINIQDIHHIICSLHSPQINFYRIEMKSINVTLCELIEYNYVDLPQSHSQFQSLSNSLDLDQQISEPITIYSYGSYLTDIFSSFINQSSDIQLTQNLLISLNYILLKKESIKTNNNSNNNNNNNNNNNADDNKSSNTKIKPLPRYYLSPKQLSSCLFSMKSLSSTHRGVSEVIESLSIYLMKSMNDPLNNGATLQPTSKYLTGKEISYMLQGMSFMSDEDTSAKRLLLAIHNKLQYFTDISFTVSDICLSLNGFRGMTSKYVKITQIIGLLIEKYYQILQNNTNNTLHNHIQMNENDLSLAFSGLRQITPTEKLPNLISFVDILVNNSMKIIHYMSFKTLQIIFTNVIHIIYNYFIPPTQFIDSLLTHLIIQLNEEMKNNNNNNNINKDDDKNKTHRIMLLQSLHLFKDQPYNSQTTSTSSSLNNESKLQQPLPQQFITQINYLINSLKLQTSDKETININSKYDNKIYNQLHHLLIKHSYIKLSRYELINGFSTDIILRISSNPSSSDLSFNNENYVMYNIEIDGPIHKIPAKELYYKRRDLYFQDILKIKVIRISLMDCGYLSKMQTTNYLKKIIQEQIKELKFNSRSE